VRERDLQWFNPAFEAGHVAYLKVRLLFQQKLITNPVWAGQSIDASYDPFLVIVC
jgi:hypothetical protein